MKAILIGLVGLMLMGATANADTPADDDAPGYNQTNINQKVQTNARNHNRRASVSDDVRVRPVPRPRSRPDRTPSEPIDAGHTAASVPVLDGPVSAHRSVPHDIPDTPVSEQAQHVDEGAEKPWPIIYFVVLFMCILVLMPSIKAYKDVWAEIKIFFKGDLSWPSRQ